MDRTACTEPQCLYSTAIPLLPYWPYCLYTASVPIQYSYTSTPPMVLRACTASVPIYYSYTSTLPMGLTSCTEPQCLYSTAIPLLSLWALRPVQSLSACIRVHFLFRTLNKPIPVIVLSNSVIGRATKEGILPLFEQTFNFSVGKNKINIIKSHS